MDDVLNHPAVQAGIAPFAAALVAALVLARTRWVALAQAVALLVVAALAIGFTFEPLTATRKFVWVALGTALGVVLIESARAARARHAAIGGVAALLAAGTVWILWRLLVQRPAGQAWAYGLASALFVAALAVSACRAGTTSPIAAAAGATVMGIGSGLLVVLGSSLLLAQAAIAVGAGAAACVIALCLRFGPSSVASAALPATITSALAVLLVAWQGTLPWYALLPLLAVPWAAGAAPAGSRSPWPLAAAAGLRAAVPMVLALGLALAAGLRFPTL